MTGTAASDIVVSVVTALSVLGGAAMGLYGVLATVRKQKRPRIFEMDHETLRTQLTAEIERRIKAELEVEVWKKVALQSKGLPDLDV